MINVLQKCSKGIVNVKSKVNGKILLGSAFLATCTPFLACADGTTTTSGNSVTTAIGTSFQSIETDALTALSTVAPYAITIVGVFLVWKYGVKFFKSVAGK